MLLNLVVTKMTSRQQKGATSFTKACLVTDVNLPGAEMELQLERNLSSPARFSQTWFHQDPALMYLGAQLNLRAKSGLCANLGTNWLAGLLGRYSGWTMKSMCGKPVPKYAPSVWWCLEDLGVYTSIHLGQ